MVPVVLFPPIPSALPLMTEAALLRSLDPRENSRPPAVTQLLCVVCESWQWFRVRCVAVQGQASCLRSPEVTRGHQRSPEVTAPHGGCARVARTVTSVQNQTSSTRERTRSDRTRRS